MKIYIKPEISIYDMKAMGIMAGTDLIIASGDIGQDPTGNNDQGGAFAKEGGHFSLFDWDNVTGKNAWNTWDDK